MLKFFAKEEVFFFFVTSLLVFNVGSVSSSRYLTIPSISFRSRNPPTRIDVSINETKEEYNERLLSRRFIQSIHESIYYLLDFVSADLCRGRGESWL